MQPLQKKEKSRNLSKNNHTTSLKKQITQPHTNWNGKWEWEWEREWETGMERETGNGNVNRKWEMGTGMENGNGKWECEMGM